MTFLLLQVVGTISRKDLMGFAIEERLERLLINPPRKLSRSVVLALKKNYGHKKPRGGATGGSLPLSANFKNSPCTSRTFPIAPESSICLAFTYTPP